MIARVPSARKLVINMLNFSFFGKAVFVRIKRRSFRFWGAELIRREILRWAVERAGFLARRRLLYD